MVKDSVDLTLNYLLDKTVNLTLCQDDINTVSCHNPGRRPQGGFIRQLTGDAVAPLQHGKWSEFLYLSLQKIKGRVSFLYILVYHMFKDLSPEGYGLDKCGYPLFGRMEQKRTAFRRYPCSLFRQNEVHHPDQTVVPFIKAHPRIGYPFSGVTEAFPKHDQYPAQAVQIRRHDGPEMFSDIIQILYNVLLFRHKKFGRG